ncbi:hypothetical protein [Psychromonas sp. Urea-02u-13]|uniref:hypothetical protein n=1 Tax=Psychromonas sp. Urea-02u-13 TaxID=2058326 RepID=UPI0012FEDB15|nr:hypothetical protein [Psychromonas sp. Urea-02u-13]
MNCNPQYTDLINEDGSPCFGSYATRMHPNPLFYKYKWRVFHSESVCGKAFFDQPLLSTADAMELMSQLKQQGNGYLIYNAHYPRSGQGCPFDPEHHRWKDSTFEVSFFDDTDPLWNGFK